MGFTELTLNAIPEGSRAYQFLMQIWKAGERARDMVNQILAFSRKSGQKRPVQLALVVEDAIKLLRATITANITINTIIASPETMVLADPAQMHLVLMNLGTNAAQAMREKGGTLEVTLEEKYLN